MSLSRWLFSKLVHSHLSDSRSWDLPYWFAGWHFHLLPLQSLPVRHFLVWAPWWTFITVDFVCWLLACWSFHQKQSWTYWSHVEPTQLSEMLFTKGIKLSPRKWWQLLKFSRVSHMNTLVPDKWDSRDAAAGWYLLDISTWISPRHFTLRHLLSVTKPVLQSPLSSSFMSSSHLPSPETLESSGVFSFLSSFPPSPPPLLSKSVIRFFGFHHPHMTLNHCSLWQLQCYLLPCL